MAGAIHVDGLAKQFPRYPSQRPRTLKEAMLRGWRSSRPTETFWALRDVGFDVASGTMLGVIGENGAGKSTLLKLLGGVLRPDAGSIHTEGHVSGLLELNSGMHGDLSGRENLMIGGVVAGLSLAEVKAKFDEIVAFAELEEFIDSPLRTYSAGMKLRLGFSVAVHGRPGVLLIDEVLSVGDYGFQAKCIERIRAFRDQGSAIMLITHDLPQMAGICDQALWLRQGVVAERGDPSLVAGRYRVAMESKMLGRTVSDAPDRVTRGGTALRVGSNRFGSLEMEILDVRLLNSTGEATEVIEAGQALGIEVDYAPKGLDEPPVVGISIGTSEQETLLDINTADDQFVAPVGGTMRGVSLSLDRLDLAPGDYHVSVGLYQGDWSHAFDYHWRVYALRVSGDSWTKGLINPPRRWSSD